METEIRPKKLSLVKDEKPEETSAGNPDAKLALKTFQAGSTPENEIRETKPHYYYDEPHVRDIPLTPATPPTPGPVVKTKKSLPVPTWSIIAAAAMIVIGLVGWILLSGSSSKDGKYMLSAATHDGVVYDASELGDLANYYIKIDGKKGIMRDSKGSRKFQIRWNKNHMTISNGKDAFFDAEYNPADQTITLNYDDCQFIYKKQH